MTRRRTALLGAIAIAAVLLTAPAAQTPAPADGARGIETFDAAWTIIRDSHFDPTMNGVDWPAVRAELAPRAARAQTEGELRDVIRDMLGRLGLSHFALIPSGRGNTGGPPTDLSGDPGFDVRIVGSELRVTHVDAKGGAAAAGIKPGWRVLSIDGTPVTELLSRLPDSMPDRLRHGAGLAVLTGSGPGTHRGTDRHQPAGRLTPRLSGRHPTTASRTRPAIEGTLQPVRS